MMMCQNQMKKNHFKLSHVRLLAMLSENFMDITVQLERIKKQTRYDEDYILYLYKKYCFFNNSDNRKFIVIPEDTLTKILLGEL